LRFGSGSVHEGPLSALPTHCLLLVGAVCQRENIAGTVNPHPEIQETVASAFERPKRTLNS